MAGDISKLRGDVLADWTSNNDQIYPRELALVYDDTTGVGAGFVMGRMILNNPTMTTAFNDLEVFPVYTQAEQAKLGLIHMLTGSEMVDILNTTLNTDLATLVAGSGIDAATITSLLDSYLAGAQAATTADPAWRRLYISTFNGRDPDVSGDMSPATDDYTVGMITGLTTALAGKAATVHTHTQASVDNLVTNLAGKVNTTDLGVTVATLVAGKVPASQLPTGTAGLVSFNGRTAAAVVPTAGDYTATMITYTPHTTIAATTVQAAMNELIDETVKTSAIGGVSGVCPLDASQYVPLANLRPADSAVTTNETIWWKVGKTNETIPIAATEYPDLFRPTEDLTQATNIALTADIAAGSAGSTGSYFKIQYAVAADGYVAYTDMGLTLLVDGSVGTGTIMNTPVACPVGARTTATRLKLMYGAGNGTTVSSLGHVGLAINNSIPINTGSTSGAAIVSAIDTELGSTLWRASASANTLALTTLVNATGAGVIGATGAGSWAFQTPAAARSIIGALQSSDVVFKGRAGATITPTTGDYTSDQITDGAAKVQMTVAERAKVATWREVRFYTSNQTDVGLNEAWAIWKGTGAGQLTLTATVGIKAISISNWTTFNLTVVTAGGQGLQSATGGTIASLLVLPASAADAPTSICLGRDGTSNAWRLS